MATFDEELEQLADDFVDELGSTSGIQIWQRTQGSIDPSTLLRSYSDTSYTVVNFVRSRHAQAPVGIGGGGHMRVEEVFFSVTVADLQAAGWDPLNTIDESWQVADGSKTYRVSGAEYEVGDKLIRIKCRADSGAKA